MREDHGTDAAIVAQNNALSVPYEDNLWHVTAGLQEAYLDGQVDGSNNRLDVAAIGTRFDDGSATPDGSPLRWGIPKSALSVSTHTGYSEQAAGLVDVVNNHTPALLNSAYPSAPDDSVVTLLFARDDHYISTAMGDTGPGTVTVNDTTGAIAVGLAGTHVTTYSTLNWAPFTKTAEGWIAADVYPVVDNLVTQLGSVITDADLTALSGGVTPDDLDLARRGAISVAQNY
ncbi:MAG: hypothetical protein KDI55_25400 [Anaerolineae bacterium]|nr:hypothetical protein [Anaerolineae bacterium]